MDFSNQRVIILGASSGMGLATARRLAAAGAAVVITARNQVRLEAAVASCPGDVTGHAFDARDGASLASFFAACGPFDHLVLALSGGAAFGPLAELAEKDIRETFESKFWPYVNAMRLALPGLSAKGSITVIAGSAARKAGPGMSAIAASNGALVAMIAPLALELAPRRINAVCPGLIDTPYWDHVAPARRAEMFAWSAARVPVGRVGTAEDIAHAVTYVIANSFTTGSIIDCNGGVHVT
jgi:NAD(P)-dependent dehydrogenase (short-subunit alcohol dehydrogenase family)